MSTTCQLKDRSHPTHVSSSYRAGLRGNQLLQIAHRVVGITFDAHLFPQAIIANDFNHWARVWWIVVVVQLYRLFNFRLCFKL